MVVEVEHATASRMSNRNTGLDRVAGWSEKLELERKEMQERRSWRRGSGSVGLVL